MIVASDVALTHLDVAYRFARWLVRNDRDAEAVVLESVRNAAGRSRLPADRGERAWFLRIVSNVCHARSFRACAISDAPPRQTGQSSLPDSRGGRGNAVYADETSALADAIGRLPDHLREVLVLRDLEGLSYQELAEVIDLPVETLMSRLSRARRALAAVLSHDCVPA
jgi:RNA polymerase sigma-70 factor, ECF subfamily